MKPDPHSAEFADLIGRWLDETATAEEAERLWQAVGECPECARELAAAARFEALLGAAVAERAAERKLMPTLTKLVAPSIAQPAAVRRPTVWRQPEFRWILATAALVTIGFFTALFWPEAPPQSSVAASHETVAPIPQPPLRRPKKQPEDAAKPAQQATASTPEPVADPTPLVHRLDRFFLTGVSLEKVPLGRAIGILQGQLREVNYEDKLMLDQLRVLVPTDASQRRVTLHCGPIPFLKAVRAVAALAGCDVVVSEPQITITIQQSIYPQLAEKRILSDMLAGRLTADGRPLVDDPARLAALSEDAATLGVALQADGSVAMTRGQWEALRMLTETRDYIGTLAVPTYAIYAVKTEEPEEETRVLTPAEVPRFRELIGASSAAPLLSFTPQLVGPENAAPIQLKPVGDTVSLAVNDVQSSSNVGPEEGAWQSFGTLAATGNGGVSFENDSVLILGGANTFTGNSVVSSATLDTYKIQGVGSNTSQFRMSQTIRVTGNISAETMTQARAYAYSIGATLVIVPVDPPPP